MPRSPSASGVTTSNVFNCPPTGAERAGCSLSIQSMKNGMIEPNGWSRKPQQVQDRRVPSGLMRPLPPEALAARFRLMRDHLRCVVINACFSVEQAAILAEHVDTVIAMEGDISDPAAVAFSMGFYGALGAAGSEADFDEAFDLACAEMRIQGVANVERPFIMTEKGMRHCL